MNLVLYTTHCPKCKVLEAKLKEKHAEYTVVEDAASMEKLNIKSVPVLEHDGKLMGFLEAVKFVNSL